MQLTVFHCYFGNTDNNRTPTTIQRISQQHEQPCYVNILHTACDKHKTLESKGTIPNANERAMLLVAPMLGASVEMFTWDLAGSCATVACGSSGCSSLLVFPREPCRSDLPLSARQRGSKGKDEVWRNAVMNQLACRGTALVGAL